MATMNFKTVLPYYYQPQDISTGILPNTPLYVPEVINNPLNDPNAWSRRLYDYFGSRNESTSNKRTQKKSSQSKTPNYSGNFSGNIKAALQEALRITGSPQSWLPYMEWLVSKESSGNPRAVNPTPVGSEHATGLLQTLPSTFKAYALPGYGNIYNPLDNAIAAIRYIKSRYGSPANIPGIFGKTWKGY